MIPGQQAPVAVPSVGHGYRSFIDHELRGQCLTFPWFGGTGDVVMPATVLGVRGWQAKYISAFVRRYPFVFSGGDERRLRFALTRRSRDSIRSCSNTNSNSTAPRHFARS
jgi:hypothetical protein